MPPEYPFHSTTHKMYVGWPCTTEPILRNKMHDSYENDEMLGFSENSSLKLILKN